MTKNPFVNALAALIYITVVASIIYYGPHIENRVDSVFVPIAMISLFTLSAAVMGYLFFLQPVQLYLDAQKKEAVNLLFKTILSFAGMTLLIFVVLFLKTL
jgi:hypothetical protein